MSDEELIKRLRAYAQIEHAAAPWGFAGEGEVLSTAAGRIESLVWRLETAVDVVAESGRLRGQAEARAERLETMLHQMIDDPEYWTPYARAALKGADHE